MIERGQAENLPPVPPADKQAQLRRHFAVVEQILIRNTEKSFALAIQRLQESLRKTRSQEERQQWRDVLRQRRHLQIQRLREYRHRGRFPINKDQPGCALPNLSIDTTPRVRSRI